MDMELKKTYDAIQEGIDEMKEQWKIMYTNDFAQFKSAGELQKCH